MPIAGAAAALAWSRRLRLNLQRAQGRCPNLPVLAWGHGGAAQGGTGKWKPPGSLVQLMNARCIGTLEVG